LFLRLPARIAIAKEMAGAVKNRRGAQHWRRNNRLASRTPPLSLRAALIR